MFLSGATTYEATSGCSVTKISLDLVTDSIRASWRARLVDTVDGDFMVPLPPHYGHL
ncbi:MAG: hypothetical protein Q7S30_05520 [Candidatus Omnitrophota bacterium]|nr:hypothetical protein [Candidatus Omnitrophota bacterium]